MSTTARTAEESAAATPPVVRVSVPKHSFASELRAIRIVWRRDLMRFTSDRIRVAASLVQPLLFLFVLGEGLQRIASAGTHGVALKTFIYPGVLCVAVMVTAMFSSASIVWDREFGFMREMLVAPVRRSSIVIGKCLGAATVACLQGVIMILLAGFVSVPYAPVLIVAILALQFLLAFAVSALGVMIAGHVRQMQAFFNVMNVIVMPMFFVSGALFPVAGLARWLEILNRIDPLTYAVDPMRRLVFSHLSISPAARAALDPGVTWWGWHVPAMVEVAVVVGLGLMMLSVAIWEFGASE